MHDVVWLRALSLITATVLAACGGASAPTQTSAAHADPVTRGRTLYAEECAGCHGADGSGIGSTPALVGDGTLSRFQTAADMWEFVLSSMPPAHPEALGEDDTGAVVAFILSANGIDPGEGPFTRERAATIPLAE